MSSGVGKKIGIFLNNRVSSKEERMRLIVFLMGIVSGIIGYPLHILGVWGSGNHTLLSISVAIETGLLADFLLFYFKKISLFHAFAGYGLIMLVMQSIKIIYICTTTPPNGTYLILFNSFISMLVIILLVMGYMHVMPFVLTAISFATSIAVNIVRPGALQMQFVFFFLFVELFSCALGLMSWRNIHEMEKENVDLHNEETDILAAFNMSRDELMAYIAMSKKEKQSDKDVNEFFEHLDERSEYNIIQAVKQRETMVRMQNADVAAAFPMLSPTEADVCRLVMHGKTLKEIARLTDKTTNNISAVRIHIRKKLGLETGQDLKQFLEQNIE